MEKLVYILFCLLTLNVSAQKNTKAVYIHSHNDYLQSTPLFNALNSGAKSIEIDVFLQNQKLFVAHTKAEILPENTLENLYIIPLRKHLKENKQTHDFHFMIDIKSEPVSTLKAIESTLKKYPEVFSDKGVQVVISGNRPDPKTYNEYAGFVWFDGRTPRDAESYGNDRIAMISQNLSKFTRWRGEGEISVDEKNKLKHFIEACHQTNKKVRLWNTGDSEQMYNFLISMGVDYINTDKPAVLQRYLIQKNLITNNN